jgi:hypothetical protein
LCQSPIFRRKSKQTTRKIFRQKRFTTFRGSDQPGGVYSPDKYEFKSAVRVIGFAEFEVIDPSEYTRAGESLAAGDSGDLGPYQPGQVRGRFIGYVVKPGDVPLE